MLKSYDDLVHDALEVQNAVNLSGVVYSLWNDVLPSLRELGVNSTKNLNEHPIVKAFIYKLYDLSFGSSYDVVRDAMNTFNELEAYHKFSNCQRVH